MSKKLPASRGAIIQINQRWADKRLSPNQWPENKRTHLQTEEEFFLCVFYVRAWDIWQDNHQVYIFLWRLVTWKVHLEGRPSGRATVWCFGCINRLRARYKKDIRWPFNYSSGRGSRQWMKTGRWIVWLHLLRSSDPENLEDPSGQQ